MMLSRKQDIAQRFSRAANSYATHAALQAAIADYLLSTMSPTGVVLDAGCGLGRESARLADNANVEAVIALDMAPAMLSQSVVLSQAAMPDKAIQQKKILPLLSDMERMPLANHSIDTIFSNFAMQWSESSSQVLAEMSRILKMDGLLHFSVPGPQSLHLLRQAGLKINEFVSQDEWCKALQQSGFHLMETTIRYFALYYDSPRELLKAIKAIGAGNTEQPRENYLRSRQWWLEKNQKLESLREPEGLPLRYEVIFFSAQKMG